MKAYETSATVQGRGEVHVAGVPFAPGTEVEVVISPKVRSGDGLASVEVSVGSPNDALGWEGNVLVHHGSGAGPGPFIADVRDEHLDRLG